MKVLIIDDDEAVRHSLRITIEEGGWEIEDQGFDGLDETLGSFRPDAVVLDLVKGDVTDEPDAGNRSFDQIRDRWFCPVVVWSAFEEHQEFEHPLVERVSKGKDTDVEVVRCLEKSSRRH